MLPIKYEMFANNSSLVKVDLNDCSGRIDQYAFHNCTNLKDISIPGDIRYIDCVALSRTSYTYSGKACVPAVSVKYDGKVLKKGTDYTLSYKNNVNVGTATIIIAGKGNYTGTLTKTFTINKAANKITATSNSSSKKATIKWSKLSYVSGYQIQYGTKSNFSGAKISK